MEEPLSIRDLWKILQVQISVSSINSIILNVDPIFKIVANVILTQL